MAADLSRFIEAQEGIYPDALAELHRGRKTSHWMWFIFPQIAGLGRSEMARFYAIRDVGEARTFLVHDLLGARLRECSEAVLSHAGKRSAEAIFGDIDAVKLRSSMTLFEAVAEDPALFADVIESLFDGSRDQATLALLDG